MREPERQAGAALPQHLPEPGLSDRQTVVDGLVRGHDRPNSGQRKGEEDHGYERFANERAERGGREKKNCPAQDLSGDSVEGGGMKRGESLVHTSLDIGELLHVGWSVRVGFFAVLVCLAAAAVGDPERVWIRVCACLAAWAAAAFGFYLMSKRSGERRGPEKRLGAGAVSLAGAAAMFLCSGEPVAERLAWWVAAPAVLLAGIDTGAGLAVLAARWRTGFGRTLRTVLREEKRARAEAWTLATGTGGSGR